ncbi:hypothetical protein RFI_35672 [Reticulomyxa filosa]|uniref:Uncharacterized protein n=1 Tax=Reticulomyxa filosa TaxID=46433 RepID=X6LKV6_RETFI|nr:hypothetical protein RFI_35672 [Reticulomyxa filosa]|eukprot:ETO01767.1 hypothetical protein RFI_35672 [Reticulomyxa filosa]
MKPFIEIIVQKVFDKARFYSFILNCSARTTKKKKKKRCRCNNEAESISTNKEEEEFQRKKLELKVQNILKYIDIRLSKMQEKHRVHYNSRFENTLESLSTFFNTVCFEVFFIFFATNSDKITQ